MFLVCLNATLANKMSAPGYEREPLEAALRDLLAISLVPSLSRSEALTRLRSHLEDALVALDDLERSGDLSFEDRRRLEALRDLQRALEGLE